MTGPLWCEFDDRPRFGVSLKAASGVSLMTGPVWCEFDDRPCLVWSLIT